MHLVPHADMLIKHYSEVSYNKQHMLFIGAEAISTDANKF